MRCCLSITSFVKRNSVSVSTGRLDFSLSTLRSSLPCGPDGLRSLTHDGVGAIVTDFDMALCEKLGVRGAETVFFFKKKKCYNSAFRPSVSWWVLFFSMR